MSTHAQKFTKRGRRAAREALEQAERAVEVGRRLGYEPPPTMANLASWLEMVAEDFKAEIARVRAAPCAKCDAADVDQDLERVCAVIAHQGKTGEESVV